MDRRLAFTFVTDELLEIAQPVLERHGFSVLDRDDKYADQGKTAILLGHHDFLPLVSDEVPEIVVYLYKTRHWLPWIRIDSWEYEDDDLQAVWEGDPP